MSNEYKDWECDKIEEEKQVVTEYPFLRVRDIDGTPDFGAKFPMMSLEIPDGWMALFFQMCDAIKPLLEEEGLLNDFYFIQVKEKYNYLRCYSNGRASHKIEEIIAKYEQMAPYVCTICGCPASYETKGYIASLCEDCWKHDMNRCPADKLEFKPYFIVNTKTEGVRFDEKKISFASEWDRYIQTFCGD